MPCLVWLSRYEMPYNALRAPSGTKGTMSAVCRMHSWGTTATRPNPNQTQWRLSLLVLLDLDTSSIPRTFNSFNRATVPRDSQCVSGSPLRPHSPYLPNTGCSALVNQLTTKHPRRYQKIIASFTSFFNTKDGSRTSLLINHWRYSSCTKSRSRISTFQGSLVTSNGTC